MTRIIAHVPPLFVGVPGRIEFDIVADKATPIDFIDVTVRGHQGWTVGSGRSAISHRLVERYIEQRLMGEGVLPSGTTRLGFDITLPPSVPPTHAIDPAHAFTELRVRVSNPSLWRFDDRERFLIPVRHPPGPPVPARPSVWRSASLRGDEPRIELGIATTRVAAGDTLVGSVAVYHMDDRKPREVSIMFVPLFGLQGRGRVRPHVGDGLGITLELPPGSAGTSVPFAIHAPWTMTPSFLATTHVLSWQVEARTGSLFSARVQVAAPIEVVDVLAAGAATGYAMPPGLTDDRVAGAFANFAREHGWDAVRDPASTSARTIARAEGDAELQLSYAHRGEAGTYLIARVAHGSLGLGLDVTPTSPLRHVFHKDIEVDIAAWDRTHVVHARSAAQAIPVLRAAVPTLVAAAALGTLARWTDHAITFERLVIAVEPWELERASAALVRVAAAIASARELATPPPGCTVDVDAWRELARALGGHLALGDLSIAGARGTAPVHLALDFDDDALPIAVHATVGDPEHAAEIVRAVSLSLAWPAAEAASAVAGGAPEAVAEMLARWPADVVELHLANGVAAASLQLSGDAPRVVDATRVRGLVDGLSAVLGALAPDAGPYR